ncbi:hypothetical protein BBJ28_00019449 [Nothophytophthora sp. Chile5]|nr:hypothetical protein BBJ28_00019449 [Nothophytophthora sp. Chile5]
MTPSGTESSTSTSPTDVLAADSTDVKATRQSNEVTLPPATQLKKKRVTRAVRMRNQNTGGVFVDTPTKASQPSKRSRKVNRCSDEQVEGEEERNVTRSIPFSLLGADSDEDEEEVAMRTKTISGCFFALALNGLRSTQHIGTLSPKCNSKAIESVFPICMGIAQCERLAQQSSMTENANLRRRHGDGKAGKNSHVKMKKSVRFRSFDLSCLNLQYVENERVETTVDAILARYGRIMEHIEATFPDSDTESNKQAIEALRELVQVMNSPSLMYTATLPDSSGLETDATKMIYRRAFERRDLSSQHEIRLCGEYFARQFANLLPVSPPSPSPPFLLGVFSSLASSSTRFKLHELFLANEGYGNDGDRASECTERVMLDENGKPFPVMATYEHQDLGAAIHWALEETLLYTPLVQPIVEMLELSGAEEGGEHASESPVARYLDQHAADDLDHMEQYVLALGNAFAYWQWIDVPGFLVATYGYDRFRFDDEAHLFPLASIEEFIATLSREEPMLQRLEEALQAFYELKEGERCQLDLASGARTHLTRRVCALLMAVGGSSLRPEPCMECHQLITRQDNATSIKCILCSHRFHLGCLHLPDTFAQFAQQYTCPTCFLGRGGY